MRPRTKLAIGGGAATALTALGITIGAMVTAGTLVVAGPGAGPAEADALQPFGDCEDLLDWYVERGVREVGPYGWGGYPMYAYDGPAVLRGSVEDAGAPMAAQGESADGKANSATGTNTQEADVDEPDIAKTDGRLLVRLAQVDDGQVLAVTDVSGAEPRTLSRLHLPDDVYGGELLLLGDHVLVLTGDTGDTGGPVPLGITTDMIGPGYAPMTSGSRVLDIDVSDPSDPELVRTERYSGSLISARVYGDVVRLVTSTGRPELKWLYPTETYGYDGYGVPEQKASGRRITEKEALAHNRALVRKTTIEDWLPSVKTGGQESPLAECDQVLHPKQWAGDQTVAVTTFSADDVTERDSVAITAHAHVVYSSADRLYVAATRMPEPPVWRGMNSRVMPPERIAGVTDLHAFTLDGPQTTYTASGSVKGTLRDRWSMDSADGVLRVAWTREGPKTTNGITTLTEHDGELVRAGEIADLGIDENIQSVRWFDDFAVLVTFRQVDPLYTIDLADPAHPRELGALKIPGYSGYLHPIGDGLLLGLGVDATLSGRRTGSQAAVFDIGDLRNPRRTDRVGLGSDTDLPAMYDPRTFTWLSGSHTGLTTVDDWMGGQSQLIALKVAPDGSLTSRQIGTADQGWQTRILPLDDGRVAVADSAVRLLDIG